MWLCELSIWEVSRIMGTRLRRVTVHDVRTSLHTDTTPTSLSSVWSHSLQQMLAFPAVWLRKYVMQTQTHLYHCFWVLADRLAGKTSSEWPISGWPLMEGSHHSSHLTSLALILAWKALCTSLLVTAHSKWNEVIWDEVRCVIWTFP